MISEAGDFAEECEALYALLTPLDDADFERETLFKQWTLNDIMAHLYMGDSNARMTLTEPDAYLEARGTPQSLDELREHDVVLTGRSTSSLHTREGEVRVSCRLRVTSLELLRQAALEGVGLAPLPTFLARADLEAGRLVEVLPDTFAPRGALYAVYPSRRQLSVNVRTFLDLLVQHLEAVGRLGEA